MLTIIFILSIVIVLWIHRYIKKQKQVEILSSELVKKISEIDKEKKIEKQILFWIITKPSKKDIHDLHKNSDIIDLVLKIIHYEIFKKTDITRWHQEQADSQIHRNIWALNELHELNLLFNKIKQGVDIMQENEE